MNTQMHYRSWLLAVIVAGFGATCAAIGDEPAKAVKVDPELEAARKHEATIRGEENSREMARSATREIARS